MVRPRLPGLARLLARLSSVHRARSASEREAIYRFRYDVYVRELGRAIGGVDHARRWVRDDDDEADCTTHLYVGSPAQILGAVRVRTWKAGAAPDAVAELLSFDRIPGIDAFHTAEIGRFMIRRTARGRLILPALASATFDLLAGESDTDLVFCYCRPGLVDYYKRLGTRPYGGRIVDAAEGIEIPMVAVLSDEAHYRRVGAPQASMVARYFGPGRRRHLDASGLLPVFAQHERSVLTDAHRIRAELDETLFGRTTPASRFFQGLGARTISGIAASGFLVTVPARSIVTREGHRERELFVVIDGEFEVKTGGRSLSRLVRGDVFGEIAFFTKGGERTATVEALTGGRLLGLKRSFLTRLAQRDPRAALTVLTNLGEILAERLAHTSKGGAPIVT